MIRQYRYYGDRAPARPAAAAAAPEDRPAGRPAPALAMAYIPDQIYEDLYTVEEALSKGTLFARLDMPFHGRFRI